MKQKLQTMLKHNWRTLLLLLTLITTSQGLWGGNNVIHGDFGEGWKDYDMGSGNSVTINVTSGEHQFGLKPGGSGWQANSGTMYRTNHTDWPFDNGSVNCKIDADIAGSYTFTYKYEDGKHKITVSYPWVIRGNFSGEWKNYNISNGTTATITDAVSFGTAREFKVFTDNVYSEDGGTMSRSDCTNWVLTTGENNSKVNIDVSGTYTFTWSNDNNHKLSVTYPAYTYKLRGSWDDWSGATDFTYVSSTSWTCTKSFSVTGVYNFNIKPASGSDYKGNGKYITRAHTSETLVPTSGEGNDVSITIDHTGSYSFDFNPTTGELSVTYPTPSAPTGLYIKGPLVNNGVWTDDYRQNWSSMTYNKTNNVYTFSFNASNACNSCSDQPLHFCVSTGTDDNGKIHWAMNDTRTNWSFVNNEGSNFVASSSLVTGTSVPVVLTITYNTSTYKYDMALTAACTAPTVTTVSGASNVTSSAARLTGNISSVGDCGSPVVGIAYGTNSSPTTLAPYSGSLSTGDFTVDISGLTAGTRYYYRAYSKSSSSDDPVYDGNVYSFYTNPSDLYIKGPLVYDSSWDPYINSSTVGYSHSSGTNVFVFAFNARTGGGGHDDYREYCVSTSTADGGKIHSSMDGTTSGWSFESSSGSNFVASSTIVSEDETPIEITITYNNNTGLYHMVLTGACSGAPTIDSDLSSSTTWSKCGNADDRQLSITASGGSGTLTYQWFRNSLASETGATAVTDMVEGGNTYSPSSTDYGTYYYYCVVRSGGACSANKATSSFTGQVTINQTPVITPAAVTVKQYEPVSLTATNSSVNWSITAHPGGAAADEYYLYDETKSTTMFKGKTGSYTITATSTGAGSCTATSSITIVDDDGEGC